MTDLYTDRCVRLGQYMVEHNATVRETAAVFGISKSTVHKDVTQRLREFDLELYNRVRQILLLNKEERHIRGGIATREKYARLSRLSRR